MIIQRVSQLIGISRGLLLLGMVLLADTHICYADESPTKEFSSPAGPLRDALALVAETYGVNVIAPDELVASADAPAVEGALDAAEALARLLERSQLEAKRSESGVFVVSATTQNGTSSSVTETQLKEPTPVLEEVLVLGQKTPLNYADITSSVAVTTGEEIEREPLADLYDIIQRIPNVNRQNQGNSFGFAIRGVRQGGPARAGTGPLLNVFVDDAPLNGPGGGLGPTGAWDLEQVEVYRGAQSTNFGRNSLAGAIYMRTKDPSYENEVKARAEVGNYGQRWGAIAFGGPVIEDKLAFRVAADYRETEGFTRNPLLDTFNDNTELSNLRLKLRFDPSDDLSVISTTTYGENLSGQPIVAIPTVVEGELPDASDANREASTDLESFVKTETILQSVNLNWDVSENISAQSITTYQETDFSSVNDGDLSPEALNISESVNENKTFTQEARFTYTSDKLRVSLGGFYSNVQSTGSDAFLFELGSAFGSPIPVFLNRMGGGEGDRDNHALFVDGELNVTDTFSVLFGFRYDDESFTSTNAPSTSVEPFPLPPEVPAIVGIIAQSQIQEGDPFEVSGSYNANLPKIGVRWLLSDNFSAAFVAQRAYRAGGTQNNPDDPQEQIPFDPEYLWNYELSSRGSFLNGRLTWNNNIFYSSWTDMQVRVFSEGVLGAAGFGFTDNAGEAELYGAETELRFKLNSDITTYFSAGYSKTEFLEFVNVRFDPDSPLDPVNQPNYNGNSFGAAPEFSFNAGFDYSRLDGFFGGMDLSYQSDSYNSPFNVPDNFAGEALLLNARIGYQINENFTITAIGRNLFDEEYFFQFFGSRDPSTPSRGQLGDPLTWAIRLDAKY
ncbi:MAG: TonB-dependent receptor [Pseudomonadota bacterium]